MDDDGGKEDVIFDYNGYGIYVVGIIVVNDLNGGIIGVVFEVSLLIVKVFGGENGSG